MFESTNELVYLVKFDKGYYAKKQPNYLWSFTDDPTKALQYKSKKSAVERGEDGTNLIMNSCTSYKIETYRIISTMEKVVE